MVAEVTTYINDKLWKWEGCGRFGYVGER